MPIQFNGPDPNVRFSTVEENLQGAGPNPLAPKPVARRDVPQLGGDYVPEAKTPEQLAETAEQARLEAEHGQGETFATQAARGALSALLSPGVIVGAASEAFGALTHTKMLEDFGHRLGKASTGRSAIEAAGALSEVFTGGSANEATTAADKARIMVDEQEKAWPLLSTVAQTTGAIGFSVATGGLASGGASLGAKTLGAIGAYEGAAAGAQAAYDAGAPITDVWTSALMGGAAGGVLSYGSVAGGKYVAGKLKGTGAKLAEVFSGSDSVAGSYADGRVAKSLGFSKKFYKKYGDEEIAQVASDINKAHLADGTPVFPQTTLDAARMDKSDIAERLARAHDETGAELGKLRARASAWIDEAAPELRPSPTMMAQRIETEIVAPLKGSISPASEGFARQAQKVADKLRGFGDDLSLEQMAQKRIELDPDIKFDANAPDTMKHVRRIIEDDVASRMDLAAERMGENPTYLPLKRQYESYSRGLEALEDGVAGAHGNNALGLSSNIVMAGTFAADIATGGGGSILHALAAGVGHKLLMEKGPQIMAVLARKFSRTPAAVDLAVAGGREAQQALTEISRARKFIANLADEAGPNPSGRAVAENTGHEAAAIAIAKQAGPFEPATWASAAKPPSPLARVLYRTQILDTVSKDLAPTIERSVAMRPGLDFDIDPARLGKLTKDADGPAAIGAVQAKVREIADSQGAMVSPKAAAARDIPAPDEIPHEAFFGPEDFHPERVDVDRVSNLGLQRSDYIRGGMRQSSLDAIRGVDDLSKLGPPRVSVDSEGNVTLVDGRHRMAVALERGETDIPVKIIQYNGGGDAVGTVTANVPILGTGVDATQAKALLEASLQRLETVDVSGAMAEAHNVVRGLNQAGAPADAKALAAVLGDDAFGEAGRAYRQLTEAPNDILREMSEPGKVRGALQTLELRGQLTQQIADEHRGTLLAHEARKKLTGEAAPDGLKQQMRDIERLWSRGEEMVTLDGARLGRVKDVLDDMIEQKVASRVPKGSPDQQVTETMKGALKNVEAAVKPSLRARIGGAIGGATRTGLSRVTTAAGRVTQYQERLEQVSQAVVAPDTETRTAAINSAPPELRQTLVSTVDSKYATLLKDMPKPRSDIHGTSYSSLSSEEMRRGMAMYEATMEPLSVFEDFARGDVDPDKVSYAWKQYPGLQKAAQMGVLDIIQSQLSDEERSALPGSVLTQLDLLLGFNGTLQGTVEFGFSQRMTGLGEQLKQAQGAAPAPPSRGLQLPTAKPTFTERIAGAR